MRLQRHEVPVQETWNLTDLYQNDAEWEGARQALTAQIPQVTAFKGRLGESAATLLAAISTYNGLLEQLLRLHTYAYLNTATDGKNPVNQERNGKANGLYAEFEAATSFVRSELLLLPEGTVEGWLTQNEGLAVYGPFLQRLLADKPYLLHPETEEALAALGEVLGAPHMIYERAKASDVTCQPITLPDGTQVENSLVRYDQTLETSADVNLRRASYRSFSEGLGAFKNTLAATFATEIKKNVVLAKLRGFSSATAMHLHEQQVSAESYHNILDIIGTELAPHMRRYAELRKRVLGLDHLLYCDLEAPLDPEFDPSIGWAEGAKITLEALSIYGPEYSAIMQRAVEERWVDFSDNVGKRTGAFCTAPYGDHPYVFMTWTNQARNMFTLAHELGHAGHIHLATQHQKVVNAMPSMFFIEVPSTLNELLVGDKLISEATDARMKRWVIMTLLRSYHHNFIRHLLEGELLRRIYALAEAGESITEGTLSATKGAILAEFWGDSLQLDEYAKLTWMRQPHYYSGLYPYTYAAGLTAATAVAQSFKTEMQPAIDRWLEVLKAGGTKAPLALMQMAGVDLTTTAPIKQAVAYVGSLVDELERLF
ncbi:MAG TPA: oligoendopeptidase F [Symbiobacteriaceae bacterium]|nr:oligoendopeptidase F [Symbiobacteriaceae bacterium]